jgi:hypothetical protein
VFSNEPLSVEALKPHQPVLRQSKGELAARMGRPKSHAAAFRFFASLEAAAIGLRNIKCHQTAKEFPQKKHATEIFPCACTAIRRSADRSGNGSAHAAIVCPRR